MNGLAIRAATPLARGVCNGRGGARLPPLGQDLQVLVHEDMRKAWQVYQQQGRWQMKGPDRQYRPPPRAEPGHLLCPPRHQPAAGAKKQTLTAWGDIVTWRLPRNLTHIGIVSDKQSWSGVPLIIHNIGEGAREENICPVIRSRVLSLATRPAIPLRDRGAISCRIASTLPSAVSISSLSMAP